MADVTKINGYIIKDANAPHPSNAGSAGQVLKKTETGTEWADAPKIQTGSYTGTGTSGRLHKRSLTFDFEPKFLIIVDERTYPMPNSYLWLWAGQPSPEPSNTFDWTISGNTIAWGYNAKDHAREALNESGVNYYWVAMG